MVFLLQDLLNEVAINCLEIARDKTGCCLLQDCVVRAEGKLKENLLESIISNSLVLSKDPYGFVLYSYPLHYKFLKFISL